LPQDPEDARGSFMKILLRGHSLGIPARLTMLALVTALPLVAVGSFAILRTVDDQRAQIQSDLKQIARSAPFGPSFRCSQHRRACKAVTSGNSISKCGQR
jgi:hypothetical protein